MNIAFIPLSRSHFPLLEQWLNAPHVKKWWSPSDSTKAITLADIEKKLGPRIDGHKKIDCYIVAVEQKPIGYIQVYDARSSARDGYSLDALAPYINHINKLASFDFYIGDANYIGKGYGTEVVRQLLEEKVKPQYDACFVDPNVHNVAAIRCYEKAGFEKVKVQQLEAGGSVIVMLWKRG